MVDILQLCAEWLAGSIRYCPGFEGTCRSALAGDMPVFAGDLRSDLPASNRSERLGLPAGLLHQQPMSINATTSEGEKIDMPSSDSRKAAGPRSVCRLDCLSSLSQPA